MTTYALIGITVSSYIIKRTTLSLLQLDEEFLPPPVTSN